MKQFANCYTDSVETDTKALLLWLLLGNVLKLQSRSSMSKKTQCGCLIVGGTELKWEARKNLTHSPSLHVLAVAILCNNQCSVLHPEPCPLNLFQSHTSGELSKETSYIRIEGSRTNLLHKITSIFFSDFSNIFLYWILLPLSTSKTL